MPGKKKKRKQMWRHSSRYLLQQHQHQHQQQQLASAIVTKLMYTSRKYLGKSSTTADFLYCHDIHIVKGGWRGRVPRSQVKKRIACPYSPYLLRFFFTYTLHRVDPLLKPRSLLLELELFDGLCQEPWKMD